MPSSFWARSNILSCHLLDTRNIALVVSRSFQGWRQKYSQRKALRRANILNRILSASYTPGVLSGPYLEVGDGDRCALLVKGTLRGAEEMA